MATATLPRVPASAISGPSATRRTASAGGAAVLSILGAAVAIGIAALGLLVVPAAAAIVFGPALLKLL
ncbi:hypothetical protein [Microbacterium sp. TNHR37B]|uniref:hypothetical protein n=1 Tax=Microbacterium sp. TNHR37B TaxID=1775956 RepID=UPI0007B24B70|nr:hypothetical protein [Microbacterium sp. TNHR37B]KZE88946.1 hypothetical protein AVP41_01737 [Microbacterium sp. TNHR37B]